MIKLAVNPITMNPLTRHLWLLCWALLFLSCEKFVEKEKKDALVAAMTNGHWVVNNYLEGTADITSSFEGYSFRFTEEGLVYGLKGNSETVGRWSGDLANLSVVSEFPGTGVPLNKLNGTWKVTRSTLDTVHAEMLKPEGKMILDLRKH